jgi:hypothetical protein
LRRRKNPLERRPSLTACFDQSVIAGNQAGKDAYAPRFF